MERSAACFEALQTIGSSSVTVYVVSARLNEGLTQKPSPLLEHLGNRGFLLRMLVLNFVFAPAPIAATEVVSLQPVYAAGLVLFSLAAGAPFLIKRADISDADMALAATVLPVLMVATVVVLPVALPLVIEGLSVGTGAIVGSLLLQMILPLAVGMVARQLAEGFVAPFNPGSHGPPPSRCTC